MFKIEVNPDKCVGDEECIEVCPVDVFKLQNGKSVPVNSKDCIGCESCIQVCDFVAIKVTEVIN